jgi:hypothetical protein
MDYSYRRKINSNLWKILHCSRTDLCCQPLTQVGITGRTTDQKTRLYAVVREYHFLCLTKVAEE